MMGFNRSPKKVFLVHGEPDASVAMAEHIRKQFKWDVVIPQEDDYVELEF